MKTTEVGRLRTTKRLVSLIYRAQANRYMPSLSELAREHSVCTRTIRRDLEAIELVTPVRWRWREDE